MSAKTPASAPKDQVLTLNDWWDGPRLGLATFRNGYCIFERVFSRRLDEYTDRYYLTPVDEATARAILDDCTRWLRWMAPAPKSAARALAWQNTQAPINLETLAAQSPAYRRDCRRGIFSGTPTNFVSELCGCAVQWLD